MLPMQAKNWIDTNGGWVGLGGLVVGLIAVVLAIIFRPRQSKGLGWKYQSANRIIRVTQAQRNRLPLKVVYGEQDVDDPNIIILRILNAGGQAIEVGDFDRPITIEFKESKLLALDVIAQSSKGMSITFKVDTSAPNRVTLNPMLLNAGEWVELQFVTDGNVEQPPIEARIVGQTMEPFDIRAAPLQLRDFVNAPIISLIVITVAATVVILVSTLNGKLPFIMIGFILVFIYVLCASVNVIRQTRE